MRGSPRTGTEGPAGLLARPRMRNVLLAGESPTGHWSHLHRAPSPGVRGRVPCPSLPHLLTHPFSCSGESHAQACEWKPHRRFETGSDQLTPELSPSPRVLFQALPLPLRGADVAKGGSRAWRLAFQAADETGPVPGVETHTSGRTALSGRRAPGLTMQGHLPRGAPCGEAGSLTHPRRPSSAERWASTGQTPVGPAPGLCSESRRPEQVACPTPC